MNTRQSPSILFPSDLLSSHLFHFALHIYVRKDIIEILSQIFMKVLKRKEGENRNRKLIFFLISSGWILLPNVLNIGRELLLGL